MYKGRRVLATICARGGSKGVKSKNIRLLDGKPIICYTLDLINDSKWVDEYIISTDSNEIMQVVKNAGFEIKFTRPEELAGDKVSRIDVIQHAVKWLEENEDKKFDVIVDLGVATPLKSSDDLDDCIKLLVDSNANNVFSVCKASRNPYFNMVESVNGKISLSKVFGNISDRRDAPEVFEMNDGFNVWKHDILFTENCQFTDSTQIYVMPRDRSIDIDEEEDFEISKIMLEKTRSEKTKSNILANKVIVIAGGCGRIGEKFTDAVIENGGIAIVADLNEDKYFKIAKKYPKHKISFFNFNMGSKESITNLINSICKKYEKIDGFVNTSFPQTKSLGDIVENLSLESFNESLSIHLGGYFLSTQQFANFFKKQGYGSIVNISSIQGTAMPKFDTYEGSFVNGKPMTSEIDYTCNKHAIIAMTKYMAKYFKGSNIRFNCISPGGILDNQPREFLVKYKKYCINKGMLDAEDLKGALLFLLSDLSLFVNGQNIVVDDGWSL